MVGADLTSIWLKDGVIESNTPQLANGIPFIDAEDDGLWDIGSTVDQDKKIYFWTRYLDTEHDGDMVLVSDEEYLLIFSHGPLYEDGTQKRHVNTGSGTFKLTFDSDSTNNEYQDLDSAVIAVVMGLVMILQ